MAEPVLTDLFAVYNLARDVYFRVDNSGNLTATGSILPATVDLNGGADALILDADGDTTISAPNDDQIDVEINGADDFVFVANIFRALSGSVLETNTINETTGGSGITVDGLLIKDSGIGAAFTVAGAVTTTGIVNGSTLDQNALIDQDTADTAGTGYGFDSLGTSTHATGSFGTAYAKVKQLTNAKTAGISAAFSGTAEGLAGDTAGATYAAFEALAPTSNGGSAVFTGLYLAAGYTNDIYFADTSAKIVVQDAAAAALTIEDSSGNDFLVIDTVAADGMSFGNATTNPAYSFLGSGLATFAGSVRVIGNLAVDGDSILLDAEHVDLEANYIQANLGYTTAAGVTGGIVVNYLPTATADTTAGAGVVTAGVDGVSDPTITTVGAATFAITDIVMISGSANDGENDGLYEVQAHAANVLTLKSTSNGISNRVEAFTLDQLVANAGDVGMAITKVTVTILRAGSDGIWEVGSGAQTGIAYSNLIRASDVGAGQIVQPIDATLTSIAALGTAANRYAYTTGVDVWAEGTISSTGRAILDDSGFAAVRATIGIDRFHPQNSGYVTAAAKSAGRVVNYLPTATVDTTVGAGVIVAGVDGVSDPTITTAGAATFAANDIVQISGSGNNGENDGYVEVVSHAANLLTVRSTDSGVTNRVEDFTLDQLVANAGDVGIALTKVTVAVDRVGADGRFEAASGAVTPLVYSDYLIPGDFGSLAGWHDQFVHATIAVPDTGGGGENAALTLQLDRAVDGTTPITSARQVLILAGTVQYQPDPAPSGTLTFGAATLGSIATSGTGWALVTTDATGAFACTATNTADETLYFRVLTPQGNDAEAERCVVAYSNSDSAAWSA